MKRAILEVYKVTGPLKKTTSESLTEKDRKAIKGGCDLVWVGFH